MRETSKVVTKDGVKYRRVPPEGGWGYMICLALIIKLSTVHVITSCFGLVYNEFLAARGERTRTVSFIFGVHVICFSVGGFMSNALLKKMSYRRVSLIGSIIFCLGSFMAIFVQSSIHIWITYGVIQPAGTGLAFPIGYTVFNTYFTGRRLAYLGAIKLVTGVAAVLTPVLVRVSMEQYGFRGTLALIFVVGLHSVLASLMLQPVEWHLRLEEINSQDEEETPLKNSADTDKEKKKSRLIFNTKQKLTSALSETEINTAEREINGRVNRRFSHNDVNLTDVATYEDSLSAKSILSLSFPPTENLVATLETKDRVKLVVDYLDLTLLKDLVYTSITIGMAVTMFVEITFSSLLPLYLYSLQWDMTSVANALAVTAGGDLAGRLVLVLTSQLLKDSLRGVFLFGIVVGILIRFGVWGSRLQSLNAMFVYINDKLSRLALLGLLGVFKAMSHVTPPLVLAAHVPLARYAAAYGLYILIYGVISVVGGPIAGLIRDVTGSYSVAFTVLNVCAVVVMIPWVVELTVQSRKRTTVMRDDSV